jgi:hypothetical protein
MENKLPRRKPRKKIYEMQIDEMDNMSGVFAISLVSDPAIEENWVYMSKQKPTNLAQISADKRLLLGPVLVPHKLIPRIDEETGEEYDITFTPETIEKAAHLYMQRQMNNNATLEHTTDVQDVSTVESWIIEDSENDKSVKFGMNYPKGTWMAMMKVNNIEIWQDFVKTGKIKGFSIEGMLGHELVKASKIQGFSIQELDSEDDEAFAAELLVEMKAMLEVELGYNTTGYNQQTQTRGLAVPPPTYGQTPYPVQPGPAGLPPNWGAPSNGDVYGNLSNYDGIALESYSDYPDGVKNNAKRALEFAEENGWGSCGTPVGKIRANQLAEGKPISVDTIKRMYSFLKRHEVDLESSTSYNDGCGKLMFDSWGGKAAMRWSASKLKELGLLDNLAWAEFETSVSVGSSYAGQFGNPKKRK